MPDVQCGVLELRLEIDLESAQLERVGSERGCDRPGPDADIDAHSTGYGENGVEWSARAIHAKKMEMPSKVRKSAMCGWRASWRMAVGKMVRQLHTMLDGSTWHGVASRGVEREREVVGFDGFDGCLAPVASMVQRRWQIRKLECDGALAPRNC